ncbi:hypothetical protein [Pseudogemmobacter faecipullorum]|uniref:Uncharacterized protein n=1 Tax=Pseudogemmobacter faecipullorum TaxID=2755041 RepID=A0ABS8CHB0_9RHOB|nr:hypothetical protein [Pseudogemmobacter faecipullorum]MCB5408583.1 hypothetical protein [Pseudogemmobacter faecipullorum]
MTAGLILLSIAAAGMGMAFAALTGQSLLVIVLSYSLSGASLLLILAFYKKRRFGPCDRARSGFLRQGEG